MKIYSRPTCMTCIMTKNILKSKGIDYVDINVDNDNEALEYIKGKGKSSLPVLETDNGEIYSGEEAKIYASSL